MRRNEKEENDPLADFKDTFEKLILETDRGWGVPSEKEASDCIDRVIAPALETLKEVLAAFYEKVKVESDKSSAVLTVTHGAELYQFSLGFSGKRRTLFLKSSSRFGHLYCRTLTTFEKTNSCDNLNFKDISEISAPKIIEIFGFDFWWHFAEKQAYLSERRETDQHLKFPY